MAKKRILSDEEELMVVRLRGAPQHMSINAIGHEVGCSEKLVRQALDKHGIGEPGERLFKTRLTRQQVAFAAGRHIYEGLGIHAMAVDYDVAPMTLRIHMLRAGVPLARRQRRVVPPTPSEPARGEAVNMLMARCARLPLPFPAGALAA